MTAITKGEAAPAPMPRSRSRMGEAARRVWSDASGRFAVLLLAVLALAALAAPLLAPHDPVAQNLAETSRAPSLEHLLGTDTLGRDVFSRLLHGLRLSMVVGIVTATASAVFGLLLGLVAGYYENTVGLVLMRLADVQFAVPFVAVGVALAAVVGPGIVKLMIILAVWGWVNYARTIANSVSQVKRMEFVTAARTLGTRTPTIMLRHIAPGVLGPVIILWSTSAGVLILVESALSLLNLGVQPPGFSLGSMLADSRTTLQLAWWATVFPGLAIMAIVVAFNLLGDALRDAFNPSAATKHDPELG
ncbi:ABC transporter permease [Actinomadura algeriensis]|uniref:ABC-type dipeptide/oligopeptide/nickel transport system permease subunit n=1 Tax=Actinomadura algeriensis TaxID=1679523 RepID=A0ABR9K147_9ACTN|nr:ABC transporter permease [Actinomadura algeriensis]MBE1536557.1 ABC-type dipeptide/oligopeptide/nickel transport system permease subunit [Actinomadura algeriensis]